MLFSTSAGEQNSNKWEKNMCTNVVWMHPRRWRSLWLVSLCEKRMSEGEGDIHDLLMQRKEEGSILDATEVKMVEPIRVRDGA